MTSIAPILPILDAEAGDKSAKEIIDTLSEQISKAINDGEEVAGVVNKEVRAFREKQMKLDKERKEKEELEEKYDSFFSFY